MSTEEGNKLIAEFMGWHFSTTFHDLPNHWVKENGHPATDYIHTELIFHTSWDWLMPVVERIEGEGFVFTISQNYCNIQEAGTSISITKVMYAPTKIEVIWQAIVKFIQWYNQKQ